MVDAMIQKPYNILRVLYVKNDLPSDDLDEYTIELEE